MTVVQARDDAELATPPHTQAPSRSPSTPTSPVSMPFLTERQNVSQTQLQDSPVLSLQSPLMLSMRKPSAGPGIPRVTLPERHLLDIVMVSRARSSESESQICYQTDIRAKPLGRYHGISRTRITPIGMGTIRAVAQCIYMHVAVIKIVRVFLMPNH